MQFEVLQSVHWVTEANVSTVTVADAFFASRGRVGRDVIVSPDIYLAFPLRTLPIKFLRTSLATVSSSLSSAITSSLPPLVQACSGALGSATANALSYPLDLVATKLQTTTSSKLIGLRGALRVLRNIYHTEGWAGLYDGLATDTASTLISNFLYFYFYALLHALAARRRATTEVPLLTALQRALIAPTQHVILSIPTELVVGFVAGVASRAVSSPLSVVTVRLQAGEDDCDDSEDEETLGTIELTEKSSKPARMSGLMSVTRSIYAEEGLRGFWAGFAPTLPLCLAPTLTLLFFQLLRRIRLPISAPSTASPTAHFFSGASANALSLALLYPLLLAKVRVQAAHSGGGTKTSVSTVWAAAYKAHGWTGMYQGLEAQLMKGFVSQGATMVVKQRIEHAVVRMYLRRQRI